ncbi:MAG: hypothetical protein LBG08_09360, partial [Spirochaetaceae bacterium]|jgi:hypothetical protein|nr:hypothetical protein [Spirochaetaceae bacterium]
MGDAIWPEENFALVVWCEEEEARSIARAVASVKERFPDEGIKLFSLNEAASPGPKEQPEAPSAGEQPLTPRPQPAGPEAENLP